MSRLKNAPRFNVRCCCEPRKILGTLRLPRHVTEFRVMKIVFPYAEPGKRGYTQIEIELRHFEDHGIDDLGRYYRERELAVFSDDRPVAFWERIFGDLFDAGDEIHANTVREYNEETFWDCIRRDFKS